MGDYRDPDYERRALAHMALTQARDALTHFDDPEVAQAAFGAHAPALVQAGWEPELVDAVHRGIGRQGAGPLIESAMRGLQYSAPRVASEDIKQPMSVGPDFKSADDKTVAMLTAMRRRATKPARYLDRDYTILYADDFDPRRSSGQNTLASADDFNANYQLRDSMSAPTGDEKIGYIGRGMGGAIYPGAAIGRVRTYENDDRADARGGLPGNAINRHAHVDDKADAFVDDPRDPTSKGYGDAYAIGATRIPRPMFTLWRGQIAAHDMENGQMRFIFPTGSMSDAQIERMRRNLNAEQRQYDKDRCLR